MTILASGWIIWNSNANPFGTPDFVPKEIYPPALQVAELTEKVYATQAEAAAAITANGGPHNYHAASAAGGLGSGAIGPVGGAVQSATGVLGNIPAYIAAAAKWISTRENWIRILQVGGGLVLMAIGVEHLSQATQSAAHTVAKAAVIA